MAETVERIPAAEFAASRGVPESAVVHRIKAGIYEGAEEGGVWYVVRPAKAAPAAKVVESATAAAGGLDPLESETASWTDREFRGLLGAWVLSHAVLILVRFSEFKSGVTYHKRRGFERLAEPQGWGDALSALVADWPVLLLISVVMSAVFGIMFLRGPGQLRRKQAEMERTWGWLGRVGRRR